MLTLQMSSFGGVLILFIGRPLALCKGNSEQGRPDRYLPVLAQMPTTEVDLSTLAAEGDRETERQRDREQDRISIYIHTYL